MTKITKAQRQLLVESTIVKSDTRYVVRGVRAAKGQTRTLRFNLLPEKQLVKVASRGCPALFVERLGPKQFLAAPRGELPRQGATAAEAMAKAVKRYW